MDLCAEARAQRRARANAVSSRRYLAPILTEEYHKKGLSSPDNDQSRFSTPKKRHGEDASTARAPQPSIGTQDRFTHAVLTAVPQPLSSKIFIPRRIRSILLDEYRLKAEFSEGEVCLTLI
jgi:hypothetical protein